MKTDGPVTFGSFNNLRKVTPDVIALWADILRQAPETRLLLKARPLADPATAQRITDLFEERGVTADRLDLRGALAAPADHLGAYGEVDIALDPFPYNGTTATCEALWMGAPVVTLAGNRHAGRVGASLLNQIGLNDCIANSTGEYVTIALRLVSNRDALSNLKRALRDRMMRSPLCDSIDLARRVEACYERMWQKETTSARHLT